jgi:hypothetical protein
MNRLQAFRLQKKKSAMHQKQRASFSRYPCAHFFVGARGCVPENGMFTRHKAVQNMYMYKQQAMGGQH